MLIPNEMKEAIKKLELELSIAQAQLHALYNKHGKFTDLLKEESFLKERIARYRQQLSVLKKTKHGYVVSVYINSIEQDQLRFTYKNQRSAEKKFHELLENGYIDGCHMNCGVVMTCLSDENIHGDVMAIGYPVYMHDIPDESSPNICFHLESLFDAIQRRADRSFPSPSQKVHSRIYLGYSFNHEVTHQKASTVKRIIKTDRRILSYFAQKYPYLDKKHYSNYKDLLTFLGDKRIFQFEDVKTEFIIQKGRNKSYQFIILLKSNIVK